MRASPTTPVAVSTPSWRQLSRTAASLASEEGGPLGSRHHSSWLPATERDARRPLAAPPGCAVASVPEGTAVGRGMQKGTENEGSEHA